MHRGLERQEKVTAGSVLYLLPFSLWGAGWSLLWRNAGCCSYCVFVFAGYGRDKSSALLVWLSSFGRILTNEVCTAELWFLCGQKNHSSHRSLSGSPNLVKKLNILCCIFIFSADSLNCSLGKKMICWVLARVTVYQLIYSGFWGTFFGVFFFFFF